METMAKPNVANPRAEKWKQSPDTLLRTQIMETKLKPILANSKAKLGLLIQAKCMRCPCVVADGLRGKR